MNNISLNEANQTKNIVELEERKPILTSYPQVVFVELTLNCNLHCHMCRPKGKYLPESNMSFELFKKVADELFPSAKVVDLRGSGESTILANFKKFVEYSKQFDTQLKLVTNLSVRNDGLLVFLIQNHFILGVSFDAATPEKFEQLRAGSKYSVVVENLIKLVNLSKKYNVPAQNIYLTTVVQGQNLQEIPNILKLAYKIGIKRIKLFPIKCSEQSPHNLNHYPKQVQEMLDIVLVLANKLDLMLEISASLHPNLTIEDCIPQLCIHPWMYCYINYQGGVGFCDHLIGKSDYLLGNINDQPFKKIWNNDSFVKLRSEHNEKKFSLEFSGCDWCYKNRYIDLEHLYYPPYEKIIVSNTTQKNCLYRILPPSG